MTASTWIYGGKQSVYSVRLHLDRRAVEHWRREEWNALLALTESDDWLTIRPNEARLDIFLGRNPFREQTRP